MVNLSHYKTYICQVSMIYVKQVQFYKQLKLFRKYWEIFGQNNPKIEDATTFHSYLRRWVNHPSEMAWIDPYMNIYIYTYIYIY